MRRSGEASRPHARVLALAILLTGIGFTLVKVAPPVALAFGWLLGAVQWPVAVLAELAGGHPVVLAPSAAPIVVDPGDLVALPALAIATWVGAARVRRGVRTWGRRAMSTDRAPNDLLEPAQPETPRGRVGGCLRTLGWLAVIAVVVVTWGSGSSTGASAPRTARRRHTRPPSPGSTGP